MGYNYNVLATHLGGTVLPLPPSQMVGVIIVMGQNHSTKVETPYHDNNLNLTPIISPQSGW